MEVTAETELMDLSSSPNPIPMHGVYGTIDTFVAGREYINERKYRKRGLVAWTSPLSFECVV